MPLTTKQFKINYYIGNNKCFCYKRALDSHHAELIADDLYRAHNTNGVMISHAEREIQPYWVVQITN